MKPAAPEPTWLWRASEKIRAARIGDPDVEDLVAAIDDYRARAELGGLSLEGRLGLIPGPDERPWFSAGDRRHQLVDQLAGLVGGNGRAAARAIQTEAVRFQTRVWPRCRSGSAQPRTAVDRLLFELHEGADAGHWKWPLADRRLRALLGNG